MLTNIQIEKYWKFSGNKNSKSLKITAKSGIESE